QRADLPRLDQDGARHPGRRRGARTVRDEDGAARRGGRACSDAGDAGRHAERRRLCALEGQRDRDAACAAPAAQPGDTAAGDSVADRGGGHRPAVAASVNTAPPAAPSPDAGAQPQRTALAWSRTGLAVSVNAVLVLRLGEASGQTLTTALGIFLLLAA